MRERTAEQRRRLHELARAHVARHYARPLTLAVVARELATSPRALQRAYEQAGAPGFAEDLRERRIDAAAVLLAEHRSIAVGVVAQLVGYRQPAHFARAFAREYGVVPSEFRRRARSAFATQVEAAGSVATTREPLVRVRPATRSGRPPALPAARPWAA